MEAQNDNDFWNRAAETKQFSHPLDHVRLTRALPRDAVILDYGCGQGRLSRELIDRGFVNVLGFDSSTEMIRIASERVPEAGRFRLPDGAVLRHHSREWFDELLGEFRVEEAVELDAKTMNGNPARIIQLWARTTESSHVGG